jgi:hypothetical protein
MKWLYTASIHSWFVLVMISTLSSGQPDTFTYRRALSDITQEDWYSLPLPKDIFQHTRIDFSDLRIFSITNSDTLEIPYLLIVSTDAVTEEDFHLPILNQSRSDDKLYFMVEVPSGKVLNTVNLDLIEKNLNAFVTVEGSDDRKKWFEVASKRRILSIFSENVDYEATSITFPPSSYNYLRISVASDIPLTLEKAYFKNITIKKGVADEVHQTWLTDPDQKQQTILRIKSASRMPVNELVVEASHDMDYYRTYTLEYAHDSVETERGWIQNYSTLQRGYLTSFDTNRIEFKPVVTHELKLTVFNQDNSPITVKKIRLFSPQVELTARLKPGKNYLYYGYSKATKPNYDLVHFEDRIPEERNMAGLLTEEKISQRADSRPLFAGKLWLWAIMIVVIGILGYFTIQMLAKKN